MFNVTRRPQDNIELIRRVLGGDYLELSLKRLVVEEDQASHTSKISLLAGEADGHDVTVEGQGCGLVDALHSGLLSRYGQEYPSLKTIQLLSFAVRGQLDTKKGQSGVDALGTVTIEVKNSEGKHFSFADQSRSIVSSTACAVLAVVEYFVNAERAFITLYKAREDAIERRRTDLVTRYTEELSEVVKSTSYTEVIESIKKKLPSP